VRDDFYRAVQAKFEGAEDAQRMRLHGYLPFVYPLLHTYPAAPALELGSSSSSAWSQLLRESGFNTQTLDATDPALLANLAALPEQSQAVISAFRSVEHLPFEQVRLLVQSCLRILKPGGLLILEAPNPENLVLGAGGYYAIPNRQLPVAPELLAFVPEYYGYARTKIVRRLDQLKLDDLTLDQQRFGDEQALRLFDVLNGVSPAYAVIAQKSSEGMAHPPVIQAFAHDYGLQLQTLTERFDLQLEQAIGRIRVDAAHTELKLQTALDKVEGSIFWKLSRPARWADNQVKRLLDEGVGERISAFKEKLTRLLAQRVLRLFATRPSLQHFCTKVTNKLGLTGYFVTTAKVVEPKIVPVEIDPDVVAEAYRVQSRLDTLDAEATALVAQLQATREAAQQNPAGQKGPQP
jgi:O-antigen chain-terminating methyltransferase